MASTSVSGVEKNCNGAPESTKPKALAPQCPVLPTEQKSISSKESASTSIKPPDVYGALNKEASFSTLKDDLSNETDPVKLERKRRQQQKKEEFLALQQMKRHKSDDGASVIGIKSEQTSPIPEGSYSQVGS